MQTHDPRIGVDQARPETGPEARELLARLRDGGGGTPVPAIPFTTLLHAILRANADGDVVAARELTRELLGPRLPVLQQALGGKPRLQRSWSAARELSALPLDFPAAARQIVATSLLTGDLASGRQRLQRFAVLHRSDARLASSQIGPQAPTLQHHFGTALTHRGSVLLKILVYGLYAALAVVALLVLVRLFWKPVAPPSPSQILAYQERLAARAASEVDAPKAFETVTKQCSKAFARRTKTCLLAKDLAIDLLNEDCRTARFDFRLLQAERDSRLNDHAADGRLEPFGSLAAAMRAVCGSAEPPADPILP